MFLHHNGQARHFTFCQFAPTALGFLPRDHLVQIGVELCQTGFIALYRLAQLDRIDMRGMRRLLQFLCFALRLGKMVAVFGESGFGSCQCRGGDAGFVLQSGAVGFELFDLALSLDDAVGTRLGHVEDKSMA